MKSILIIDDSNTNLVLLDAVLSDENYHIHTATGAAEAYKLLHNHKIDLILLDIQMPKISGFDFLKEIKSESEYNKIPVIVISAGGEAYNITKAMKLGAELFLEKPVDLDNLTKRIKEFLP